ncbi:major facilitator superfamily domain-containing protein 8-like [Actinia tenebrosa]|uniref:Major facilitator superfamily domain-containing protein 8-like n=1 Tax=Actinia tenebrosa TaxID=6105 RepID=A0A6P8HXM5_ACTTE|nr:major facilitator superfamily domain-containing protein 8-like [Actinia tenebrosa]
MQLKRKKLLTKISIGLFFFLAGVEYAVILPTMWMYSHERYGAEPWFYGVIFAAFSFSSLILSPFFGIWVDFTEKTKSTILFANLFEIGGNILYFVAWSKYWIFAGRLIAGVGAGAGSAIFAQIARTTTEEERTGVYSIAMGLRQFGLLVGPAFNIFLKETNFSIGPFKVDHYTSPGLFMAALWLIQEVIMIFMYYDLPTINEENDYNEEEEKKPLLSNESIQSNETKAIMNGTTPPVSGKVNAHDSLKDLTGSNSTSRKRRTSSLSENIALAKNLISEAVVVILASQFIMFFNETSFEALYTPLSNYYLGWRELEISISFCLIALEAILTFIIVKKLSTKLSDRWLMVIGIAFEASALILYLIMLTDIKPYEPKILPTIVIGTILIVFGLPFFSVANISLLSKITDKRTQGLYQGIQRSVTGVATILGPLWGGSLGHRMVIILSVMAGLEALLGVLMFLSFRRLRSPSKKTKDPLPSQYSEISTS